MRLVDIDDCNRELFYKQMGGKDTLITVETAFNMLMALPVINNKSILEYAKAIKQYCIDHDICETECPFYRGEVEEGTNIFVIQCELNRGQCSPCNWDLSNK